MKSDDPWKIIHDFYTQHIPFHRHLELKVMDWETGSPKMYVDNKEQYVGNFTRGNLHGGVAATLLDVVGGAVAYVEVVNRKQLNTTDELMEQFSKMGTIDIRIDYLRPGFGKRFIASGFVLRTGNKVSVTRMELHNEEDVLIAVGTGAYIVG